jgi:glycine/D-amino acid oxidase-like deaminating enzyme
MITGLFVAAGGSGHGFKFAPIIGDIVADLIAFRQNPAYVCLPSSIVILLDRYKRIIKKS